MVKMESGYSLWLIEADNQNSWFHYFDYISRFQISKYKLALNNSRALILHTSVKDFPVDHLLFVDVSQDIGPEEIKKQWTSLGSPKTLVFPGTSRLFADIIKIDQQKFFRLQ